MRSVFGAGRAVAGMAAASALLLGACGGGGEVEDGAPAVSAENGLVATTAPQGSEAGVENDLVVEIEIVDGSVVGGVRREEAAIGDSVRIVVTGDLQETVHLHGYDLKIQPDTENRELVFDALIPGRFELELEESGLKLIELTVS